ncbi:MAG: hypothetical protein N4A33_06370 [Bacteriovoracaceae bacterium]|jgi:hypothetical protein|nr:hypothetical protein [Bacteriovoracaceae bacterium]
MARTAKKAKTQNKEVSAAIKNFKTSSEAQDFYRFVFENNLRDEARMLMKLVLSKTAPTSKRKKRTLH